MGDSVLFHPHELAFCGYSGTGKTTLLVKLIRALSYEYRIGYVKHDAHRFQVDRPGKDTHRAAEAGAVDVLINDARSTARISAREPGLFDATFAMLDCDWVFIEGYKNSDLPKVLVLDADGRAEAGWRDGRFRNVIASVGPDAAPEGLPGPWFHRDDVEAITAFVRSFWRDRLARVPLYGVVLAGGESRRMERAKWALDYRGEPHALYLHRLAAEHCEKAYLSLRDDQAAEPAFDGLPVLADRFLGLGPLGGLLTALQTHPEAAWLVLACDLPHVDHATIRRLLDRRAPFRFATSYRSPHDGMPEPLCAVYEPKSRFRLFQTAALGYGCPRKMLMNAEIALVASERPDELVNANHPHEYEEAARCLRAASP